MVLLQRFSLALSPAWRWHRSPSYWAQPGTELLFELLMCRILLYLHCAPHADALILLEITTHLLHFYPSGRLSHKDLILSEVNEGGPMKRWTPDPRYTSFINKVIFSSTLVVAGMQNGRSYMEFYCLLFSQISKNGFNLSCVSIHHPSSSSFPCKGFWVECVINIYILSLAFVFNLPKMSDNLVWTTADGLKKPESSRIFQSFLFF